MYRFFIEDRNINRENGICRSTGSDVNHIANALRMKKGEQLLLSSGAMDDPVEYLCEIDEIRSDEVLCRILDLQKNARELPSRLFLFALISEIPFDFALKTNWFYPEKQNVYFTLLIGLLVLWGITLCQGLTSIQLLIMVAGLLAANFLKTDYSYKGVFLIEVLYILRYSRLYQCLGGAAAISWETWAPLSFIPVFFYNGKRGLSLKYFFYWFYPVHLLVLGVVTKLILPALA